MLVLSRHRDETIVIDPRACPADELGLIHITVTEFRGDKVRLGITAPTAMPVHRLEVWEAVQAERRREKEPAA